MNHEQYNHCVDECSDALYRFALKNLKDHDEAMEIVQISFERLWMRRESVDSAKARSYLFTMAYNAMVDFWRKQKRTTELSDAVIATAATSYAGYSGLKQALQLALDKLPEVQRTVLLLRDYEGYSYEEIGEITNLNPSQVKVYIFRARQTLKTIIKKPENLI